MVCHSQAAHAAVKSAALQARVVADRLAAGGIWVVRLHHRLVVVVLRRPPQSLAWAVLSRDARLQKVHRSPCSDLSLLREMNLAEVDLDRQRV